MKFYDFIAMSLWVTSFSLVDIDKNFIQGLVSGLVICGYAAWRIYHGVK